HRDFPCRRVADAPRRCFRRDTGAADRRRGGAEESAPLTKLTHVGVSGDAHMVDVSMKDETQRVAVAEDRVVMSAATLNLILERDMKKGDVLGAARIAGIMAAKRTHELIPLCHPLLLTSVAVDIKPDAALPGLTLHAEVKTRGQTGVEMEALTA